MEPATGKPGFLRNVLTRLLIFGLLIVIVRFAYVITLAGESCTLGDFCFFSPPLNLAIAGTRSGALAVRSASGGAAAPERYASKDWISGVRFYSSVFQDLIAGGFLSPAAKSLCLETPTGRDVLALREIGVTDAIGISKKASPPLVKAGDARRIPFANGTFDFVFAGDGALERSPRPAEFAAEIARTLKPEGFAAFHVKANDTYSFNSFVDLFNFCCNVVKINEVIGFDSSMSRVRELVVKKERYGVGSDSNSNSNSNSNGKCSVPEYKKKLVRNAEALIEEEPLKPWITLKRNVKNIRYLSSMVDISFKDRYAYVDVGARSYGSSIGSWFRKQYPKQNKTFHVYAIEADKTFHQEYGLKKGVTLLPYAAWVRNESLVFEINRGPGEKDQGKGRGMGRIQPLQSSSGFDGGEVERIPGFDFADWLKNTFSKNDFVVMKMDVEGTEFDLIPRLFETGAICLVDEIFLECHYNRWQRCCPGQRSPKYERTYDQCLQLFTSLRQSGVLVHQWF
ncbi:S-adenosyl-L-methionine-dependent methyltransferase [Vigna unguiculata]|uniref:S-adenosyl-L-methionine-dependent methyltransferase n=1 Tax=Vigna unguiculata TaxID=3917 RepID=A0A4D6MQD5_VIGUN|nr:S-adenosyl-L-methionine-dependent methyltransferase [Vigna unguiculata]